MAGFNLITEGNFFSQDLMNSLQRRKVAGKVFKIEISLLFPVQKDPLSTPLKRKENSL